MSGACAREGVWCLREGGAHDGRRVHGGLRGRRGAAEERAASLRADRKLGQRAAQGRHLLEDWTHLRPLDVCYHDPPLLRHAALCGRRDIAVIRAREPLIVSDSSEHPIIWRCRVEDCFHAPLNADVSGPQSDFAEGRAPNLQSSG